MVKRRTIFQYGSYVLVQPHTENNQDIPSVDPLEYQGESVVFDAIDDYTVRLHFAASVPRLDAKVYPWHRNSVAPAHYYRKLHPQFNASLEDHGRLIEALGGLWYFDVDRPVVQPWKVRIWDEYDRIVAERNPYYWKSDPAGQQLPYITELHLSTLGLINESSSEGLLQSIDVFAHMAEALAVGSEWADELKILADGAAIMRQEIAADPERFSSTYIAVLNAEYHYLARIAQTLGDLGGDVSELPQEDRQRLALLRDAARVRGASADPGVMHLSVTVHDGSEVPKNLLEVSFFALQGRVLESITDRVCRTFSGGKTCGRIVRCVLLC